MARNGIVFARISYTDADGSSVVKVRAVADDAAADVWRKEVAATTADGYAHLRTDTVYSVDDVKRVTRSYFFSPDTMRYFRSRIVSGQRIIGNDLFFITTESRGFDDNSRAATIRVWHGNTDTFDSIGEFGAYATPAAARRALAKIG